jgi:hypothetical protein
MKRPMIVLTCLSLAACAGPNYRPLIDSRGVDMNRYEADLRDCQQYAAQTAGAAQHAAAGALIGALLGAALATAAGSRYDARASARVGAVAGGVSGGAQGEMSQRDISRRCLAGRGYSVLQ